MLLIRLAAYLFLAGIVMTVLSAVPSVTRRYPRILLHGFGVAVLGVALAVVGALLS